MFWVDADLLPCCRRRKRLQNCALSCVQRLNCSADWNITTSPPSMGYGESYLQTKKIHCGYVTYLLLLFICPLRSVDKQRGNRPLESHTCGGKPHYFGCGDEPSDSKIVYHQLVLCSARSIFCSPLFYFVPCINPPDIEVMQLCMEWGRLLFRVDQV